MIVQTSKLERLRENFDSAKALVCRANESYEACLSLPLHVEDDNEHVVDWSIACDQACDKAWECLRLEMIRLDVPRRWTVRDEGTTRQPLGCLTKAEAYEMAEDWAREGVLNELDRTIWVEAYVNCEETGESGRVVVQIDPPEPKCAKRNEAHDWQAPHSLVGGLRDNPGVWGKGGGLIMRRVCMHCGCERTTDTWAQRPDGWYGESVSYEPGKYEDEVAALREREDSDT